MLSDPPDRLRDGAPVIISACMAKTFPIGALQISIFLQMPATTSLIGYKLLLVNVRREEGS